MNPEINMFLATQIDLQNLQIKSTDKLNGLKLFNNLSKNTF